MAYNPNQARAKDGKWEGAGGAAGAAQTGVNSLGREHVSAKVLDVIRNNPDGFSVSPKGDVPNQGYMVAIPGRSHVLTHDELHSPAAHDIINDYARRNSDVLTKPGAHIGGWLDKESGKVYLDVSHNISGQREAIKTGKLHNQIAIWDVRRGREIRTGGSGE